MSKSRDNQFPSFQLSPSLGIALSPAIGLEASYAYTNLNASRDVARLGEISSENNMHKWLAKLHFNLYRLSGFDQTNVKLAPFVSVGIGQSYSEVSSDNIVLPGGQSLNEQEVLYYAAIGAYYNLGKSIDLGLRYDLNISPSDALEGFEPTNHANKANDMYSNLSASIRFKLGKAGKSLIYWKPANEELEIAMDSLTAKVMIIQAENEFLLEQIAIDREHIDDLKKKLADDDADGVINSVDEELSAPTAIVNTKGISIDEDADGTADEFDLCPKQKGPISNNGCPTDVKPNAVIELIDGDNASKFYIINGSFRYEENAQKRLASMRAKGENAFITSNKNSAFYRVALFKTNDSNEADEQLQKYRTQLIPSIWLFENN